jgi:hypothetical protein
MRRYYSGITIFKLTGSLMVLLAHVMLIRYIAFVPDQQLQFILFMLRVIVPCFYVIAGFLAYKGWINARNPRLYVQRYLSRILIIYGVFCLAYIAKVILPALINNGFSNNNLYLQAKILIMTVILNGPYIQLWFIPPLVFSIMVSYWFYEKQYLRLAAILAVIGFLTTQILSGTLKVVWESAVGRTSFLNPTLAHYLNLFITSYLGQGFTFVMAGIILARYEEKFLRIKIGSLLIPSVILTTLESLFLLHYAKWTFDYKLAFSVLPNSIFVFYGILKIKSQAIQVYHRIINLFSIVTFFGHILFMELNLLMLKWDTATMNGFQDIIFLFLTFFECLAVTLLLIYRGKYFTAKQESSLSS